MPFLACPCHSPPPCSTPGLAFPATPNPANPCQAATGLANPCHACHAYPCLNMPCLRCHNTPHRARPLRVPVALPAKPRLAMACPNRTLPRLSWPIVACPSSPVRAVLPGIATTRLVRPCRDEPALP